jgi:hypothetical protein
VLTMSLSSLECAARGAATLALLVAFQGCNTLLDNRPADLGQDFGAATPADPEATPREAERDDGAGTPSSSGAPASGPSANATDAGGGVPESGPAMDDAAVPLTCGAGLADCNGLLADGCEANLASATSCGACGVVCKPRPGTAVACVAGACSAECLPGYGDCNADPADGCEKNLQTNKHNCGQCGVVCLFGGCQDGVCRLGN